MRRITVALILSSLAILVAGCTGTVRNLPNTIAPAAAQPLSTAREKTLYAFLGGSDGGDPLSSLIADKSEALYGTTAYGGSGGCLGGCGTVFKLTPARGKYIESVLHSFVGESDGQLPTAGLVSGPGGALYGTTEVGAFGYGIVFKLTPSGSKYAESVLYRFKWGHDGAYPLAGLTIDGSGNLFGTTLEGGGSTGCGMNGPRNIGCGIIFELKPSGRGYTEHVLYRFQGGSDGANPGSPPILVGRVFYGTAAAGGGGASSCVYLNNRGCGTVYKLTPAGRGYKYSTIYKFLGTPHDAANPLAGLVVDKSGIFYGVSQYGGAQNQGAIFELKPAPNNTERVLHSFGSGNDGTNPVGTLALANTGALYGTTQHGGSNIEAGVVFELTAGRVERVLFRFEHFAQGYIPVGGVLIDGKGALFGTTSIAGNVRTPSGTVFKLSF